MTINRVLELMTKAPADLITHDVTEYMKAGFEMIEMLCIMTHGWSV
jgi:hypothetical protein